LRWDNEEIETKSVVQDGETIQAMVCPKCHKGLLRQVAEGGAAVNVRCDHCGETYWYGGPFGLRTLDDM